MLWGRTHLPAWSQLGNGHNFLKNISICEAFALGLMLLQNFRQSKLKCSVAAANLSRFSQWSHIYFCPFLQEPVLLECLVRYKHEKKTHSGHIKEMRGQLYRWNQESSQVCQDSAEVYSRPGSLSIKITVRLKTRKKKHFNFRKVLQNSSLFSLVTWQEFPEMWRGSGTLATLSLSTTVPGVKIVHTGEETPGRMFCIVMGSTETTESEPAPHDQTAPPWDHSQEPVRLHLAFLSLLQKE